jgi:hypothetical protein
VLVDLRGCTRPEQVAAAIRALPPDPPEGPRIVQPEGWTAPPLDPGDAPASGPHSAESASLGEQAAEPASGPCALQSALPAARAAPGDEPTSATTPLEPSPADAPRPPRPAPTGGFEADPRGNLLIAVSGGEIVAAHATTEGGPTGARFAGRTAAELSRAILAEDLVSRLDHAAYLGAELARAEIALRLGLPYRQDRPLRLPERQ